MAARATKTRRKGSKLPNGMQERQPVETTGLSISDPLGIDPALVDPRRILAGIAADTSAPASARVSAAKALLASSAGDDPATIALDELSRRALQKLTHKERPN